MSTNTYAIPCPKCGYATPVDSECRRCGTVAKDESRPIANKAPSPYTIIDYLTAEVSRLRAALERIAAPNIGAIMPIKGTIDETQSRIAREALEGK